MNSPAAWQSKPRPSNEITCGSPKFPPVLIGGVGARVDGLFVGDLVPVEGDVELEGLVDKVGTELGALLGIGEGWIVGGVQVSSHSKT